MANVAKQQERVELYQKAIAQLQMEADIVLMQILEAERQLRIEKEILNEMLIPFPSDAFSDNPPDDNTVMPLV